MPLKRLLATALILGVVGGAAAGFARTPAESESSVPARLDDSTYWRLVGELSEPGGYFRSDNFVSNEGELQYVIPDLQRTVPRGRAYIGVGPEQNLTYIAALEPAVVFIIDIRRQNLVHHLMFKALMETSPDRISYVSRLLSRPAPATLDSTASVVALFNAMSLAAPDTTMFRRTFDELRAHLTQRRGFALPESDIEGLRYIFSAFAEAGAGLTYSYGQMNNQRFGGWMPTLADMMTETDADGTHRGYLASEANYRAVRSLHERNLIIPVVGDFGGPKAIRAVGDWLRRHDAKVGVFYASNVEQYLFQEPAVAAAFYANLQTLPTDSASTFVRSVSSRGWVPRRNPNSRLAQITMGIEPMLKAIREGRVANYMELVTLVP